MNTKLKQRVVFWSRDLMSVCLNNFLKIHTLIVRWLYRQESEECWQLRTSENWWMWKWRECWQLRASESEESVGNCAQVNTDESESEESVGNCEQVNTDESLWWQFSLQQAHSAHRVMSTRELGHSLRSYHNISSPDPWKWKWSNSSTRHTEYYIKCPPGN